MLSFFRRVSKSKIGTGIMAAVLIAILAGFAISRHVQLRTGKHRLRHGQLDPGARSATRRSPTAK